MAGAGRCAEPLPRLSQSRPRDTGVRPSMARTAGQMASSTIDESALSKGQIRKLKALHKSVGARNRRAGLRRLAGDAAGTGPGGPECGAGRRGALAADREEKPQDSARRLRRQARPRPDRRRSGQNLNRTLFVRQRQGRPAGRHTVSSGLPPWILPGGRRAGSAAGRPVRSSR